MLPFACRFWYRAPEELWTALRDFYHRIVPSCAVKSPPPPQSCRGLSPLPRGFHYLKFLRPGCPLIAPMPAVPWEPLPFLEGDL